MAGKFQVGDKIDVPVKLAIGGPVGMKVQVMNEVEPGLYRVATSMGIAMLMSEPELGAEPDPPEPEPPPPPLEVVVKDDGTKLDVSNLRTDVDALMLDVAELNTELGKLVVADPTPGLDPGVPVVEGG